MVIRCGDTRNERERERVHIDEKRKYKMSNGERMKTTFCIMQ